MAIEKDAQRQLAFIQELVFGTTPATPAGQILRHVSESLGVDSNYIDNPEMRSDNMRDAGRRGALKGKGGISGKLSYGTYDWALAAVLGNFDFVTNVAKVRPLVSETATTIQVAAAGKTFTRPAGSFITDGFAVGDYVTTSGFTNAGNNGTFIISTLTATVMTCTTATGLVDEGPVAAGHIQTNIRPSFTLEAGYKGNGLYFPFLGAVVDGLTLSGKVGDAVDISIDLLTKAVSNESYTSLFTTLTAQNTNPLITAWDGSVKKGGVSLGNVVGWDLKIARGSGQAEVVGSSSVYDIQPGIAMVTGSLEIWLDSFAAYTDFRAENDVALQFNLGPGGTKSYTIDLTRCRFKNWAQNGAKDGGMLSYTVEFESVLPSSGTNTNCMITRLP